jgi:S-adenosylmethionine hydrolase
VVVDPGVGSSRRPIAVRTSRGAFVGPDNGVFSYVMADDVVEAVVELADSRYRLPEVSRTFHGRDVFAPAAAYLAAGVPIDRLGPEVSDPVTLPLPTLEVESDAISGEVLHTDCFGNAITSIGRLLWKDDGLLLVPAFREGIVERVRFDSRKALVTVAGQELRGLRRTYADVTPGDLLALVGSEGHMEIAVREGSAAEKLGLHPGDRVELRC